MAKMGHVQGMLLEEVLLHLLRATGYRTVDVAGTDCTLNDGPAGLEVLGRGCKHQIDAVADFQVPHPFSHRQRLLVEAKCFAPGVRVSLPIVRNAVGVLKDASEFWAVDLSRRSGIPKSRYHYQYALFSATEYTLEAQRYAFAQDIYLIPLADSIFLTPMIAAIRALTPADFGATRADNLRVSVSGLRRLVRGHLRDNASINVPEAFTPGLWAKLVEVFGWARRINFALLGVLGEGFPVFLAPSADVNVFALNDVMNVRIRWDATSWYLDSRDDRRLFSFDLPREIFELYATEGVMTPERALDMKESIMRSFYAFVTSNGRVRVIRFDLDIDWIDSIRQGLQGRSGPHA